MSFASLTGVDVAGEWFTPQMRESTAQGEVALFDVARHQHGVVTFDQARGAGLSRQQVHRLVGLGRWRYGPGRVLILPGAPPGPWQETATALLGSGRGAWLSHDSAAAHWGIPGCSLLPTHVLVDYHHARSEQVNARIHRSRRRLAHHAVLVDGLMVTTPSRTVFDLSGTLSPTWRVERLLDHAWSSRLVTYQSMRRVIEEMSGRGQRNVAELRQLVENRGPDYLAGDSALERRFHRILAEDGQEPMERQVDMVDKEGWWGRVDAVDRVAFVLVEIDGQRWHSALTDRLVDVERRRRAEAMGFLVLRIAEDDVWYRPSQVAATVREARRKGRRRVAASTAA